MDQFFEKTLILLCFSHYLVDGLRVKTMLTCNFFLKLKADKYFMDYLDLLRDRYRSSLFGLLTHAWGGLGSEVELSFQVL